MHGVLIDAVPNQHKIRPSFHGVNSIPSTISMRLSANSCSVRLLFVLSVCVGFTERLADGHVTKWSEIRDRVDDYTQDSLTLE